MTKKDYRIRSERKEGGHSRVNKALNWTDDLRFSSESEGIPLRREEGKEF